MTETKILPLLPLRDIVVFPHMIVPLFVGRDKSVAALEEDPPHTVDEARRFFETHFVPLRIRPAGGEGGFVTAYYEPEIDASPVRTDRYRHPFYARPDDLIAIDDANRPPELNPGFAFGRLEDGAVGEYPDRRQIDSGYLEARGLEIAWAESRVDVFFVPGHYRSSLKGI